MSQRINVCVVGCGHWGKNHVRNFSQLGHLYAICDANTTVTTQLAAQFGIAKVYAAVEDVWADPNIDAVVLATPAEQHFSMGMDALRAGKDLFVEKPLALDWQEGEEMVDLAKAQKRILMVGHLLHYHPAVIRMKELLREGILGRIEYIYSNRLSMGKIRREENALWSFAPHDISVILSIVRELPLQVTCTGGAYLQPNIADVTISNLLFERGARSHIFVSWLHPYKEQRLVVIGEKQMLVFEDSRSDQKLMLYNKDIQLKGGAFEALKPEGKSVDFDSSEPLSNECQHFINCVIERKQPVTPGEEGVRVLRVLQACHRSMQLNGEPVQVNALNTKVASF
jgi:UDP-2-acetamido-3-amino-2,3-dideoxy-glucuronate N-acetyltransferase